MKKILMAIFTIMLFFSVGCSNGQSEDSLIDNSSDKIQDTESGSLESQESIDTGDNMSEEPEMPKGSDESKDTETSEGSDESKDTETSETENESKDDNSIDENWTGFYK